LELLDAFSKVFISYFRIFLSEICHFLPGTFSILASRYHKFVVFNFSFYLIIHEDFFEEKYHPFQRLKQLAQV